MPPHTPYNTFEHALEYGDLMGGVARPQRSARLYRKLVDGGSIYPGDLVETAAQAKAVLAFRDAVNERLRAQADLGERIIRHRSAVQKQLPALLRFMEKANDLKPDTSVMVGK